MYSKQTVFFFFKSELIWFKAYVRRIYTAIEDGNIEDVRKLLSCKKYSNVRDRCGRSLLHKALLRRKKEIVQYLMEDCSHIFNLGDSVSTALSIFSKLQKRRFILIIIRLLLLILLLHTYLWVQKTCKFQFLWYFLNDHRSLINNKNNLLQASYLGHIVQINCFCIIF